MASFTAVALAVEFTPEPQFTKPERIQPQFHSLRDGDSYDVSINGRPDKIRLLGIDTPEIFRPGCEAERKLGQRAKQYVFDAMTQAETVECITDWRRGGFGGLLCDIEIDGQDLGQALIANGLAQPYPNTGNIWCE